MAPINIGSIGLQLLKEPLKFLELVAYRNVLKQWDMNKPNPSLWVPNEQRVKQEVAQVVTGCKAGFHRKLIELFRRQESLSERPGPR